MDVTGVAGSTLSSPADITVATVSFDVTQAGFYEIKSDFSVDGDPIVCAEETFPPTDVSLRVGFDEAAQETEAWLAPGRHSARIVLRPYSCNEEVDGEMNIRDIHVGVYSY